MHASSETCSGCCDDGNEWRGCGKCDKCRGCGRRDCVCFGEREWVGCGLWRVVLVSSSVVGCGLFFRLPLSIYIAVKAIARVKYYQNQDMGYATQST
jgi:hypothetical protein